MNKKISMRRLFSLGLFLLVGMNGFSQVDRFEVGPYDVEYRGEGDYRCRLKKNINLFKYFGLKKDTVYLRAKPVSQPVNNGIQVTTFFALPRITHDSGFNVWGVDGTWKHNISKNWYFNAGLSLGLLFGKSGYMWGSQSEKMFEVGLPLSFEYTKLDKKKSSMYVGLGITPTFYSAPNDVTGLNGKYIEGKSGLFVAPRVDLGAYVPFMNELIRIGGYAQYNVNCVGNNDLFSERLGRFYLGANIGFIF